MPRFGMTFHPDERLKFDALIERGMINDLTAAENVQLSTEFSSELENMWIEEDSPNA